MTAPQPPSDPPARRPAVFRPDDPDIDVGPTLDHAADGPPSVAPDEPHMPAGRGARPALADTVGRGIRWGTILLSAASALATIAFGLWFTRFVSVAIWRDDWIGWLSLALFTLCALIVAGFFLREIVGLWRLRRIGRLRREAEEAVASGQIARERAVVAALRSSFAGRPELAWGMTRLRDHERDVHDAGGLLRLAEREVLAPLDRDARQAVATAVKRIAMVTVISPTALLTIGYLAFENLRLMRVLARIYGGRPGFIGSVRLATRAAAGIVAAGVVDLTADFVGQFIGQDLMRRLSARLGEGVFNGALTARLGAAAIDLIRPLPYLDAPPIRARDFIADLWRLARAGSAGGGDDKDKTRGRG